MKFIREVPMNVLEGGASYMTQHPIISGLGAAAGLGLGASAMFPGPTSSPAQILAATEMDKTLLLDDLARSGQFSGEEMLALSSLPKDEIISYLSNDDRGGNAFAGILGASAGIGGVAMAYPAAQNFVDTRLMTPQGYSRAQARAQAQAMGV